MKQKNVNAFSVLQLPGTCLLDTFIILFSDQGVRIIFSEAECHATGSITFIYDCLWRRTAMKTLAVHKGTGHISGLLLLRTALKISVQTSIHPFTSDCCLMKRWMGNWSFFLNSSGVPRVRNGWSTRFVPVPQRDHFQSENLRLRLVVQRRVRRDPATLPAQPQSLPGILEQLTKGRAAQILVGGETLDVLLSSWSWKFHPIVQWPLRPTS